MSGFPSALVSVSSYALQSCCVWNSFLGVLISSSEYSVGFSEPRGEEFGGDIPFRTESSKVSHSLRIAEFRVPRIGSHLLQEEEEAPLGMPEEDTDLRAQQHVPRGHFSAVFL